MKKTAFTLAEVLITLVVIGVIAAITVPTLMNNFKKDQYIAQLKKSYSTLTNGFKMAMVRDGVQKLSDSSLIQSINGTSLSSGDQKEFAAQFAKSFAIAKDEGSIQYTSLHLGSKSPSNAPNTYSFIMADGSRIGLYQFTKTPTNCNNSTGQIKSYYGVIMVDVNGDNKPNQYGRDVFWFTVDDNAQIWAYGSKEQGACAGMGNWQASYYDCNPTNNYSYGYGCAGRIIEQGWQMKY